jgi:hypothetical protein
MRHPLFSIVLALSLGTATAPALAQHHGHHGNSDAWKWAAGAIIGAAVIQSLNRPNVATIQQPYYPTTVYPTTIFPTTVYSAPVYERARPVYTAPVYPAPVYAQPYSVFVDGVAYARQNIYINGQLQEVLVRR